MKSEVKRNPRGAFLRMAAGILLSAAALYLAFRQVSISAVWERLSQAQAGIILLALLSVSINILAKVQRWRLLMGMPSREARFWKTFQALLAGQLLNQFFPARMGDLGRAYFMGHDGASRLFVLGTVALEKLIDIGCYAGLLILLGACVTLPAWMQSPTVGIILIAAGVISLLMIIAYRHTWMPESSYNRIKGWLERSLGKVWEPFYRYCQSGLSTLDILRRGGSLLGIGFLSVVSWSTAVLTNWLMMRALGIQLDDPLKAFAAALLVLLGVQVGISLPAVPGSIGIFELVSMKALEFFGVEQAQALGFGILLHGIVLLPVVGLGSAALLNLGKPSEAREALKMSRESWH